MIDERLHNIGHAEMAKADKPGPPPPGEAVDGIFVLIAPEMPVARALGQHAEIANVKPVAGGELQLRNVERDAGEVLEIQVQRPHALDLRNKLGQQGSGALPGGVRGFGLGGGRAGHGAQIDQKQAHYILTLAPACSRA